MRAQTSFAALLGPRSAAPSKLCRAGISLLSGAFVLLEATDRAPPPDGTTGRISGHRRVGHERPELGLTNYLDRVAGALHLLGASVLAALRVSGKDVQILVADD